MRFFSFFFLLVLAASVSSADEVPKKFWVFFGTSCGKSKGVYRSTFDAATGKLSEAELVAETPNPGFVTLSSDYKYLFAVSTFTDSTGKKGGGVSSFSIDQKTGKLTLINTQSSKGDGPCHVSVDKAGKHVFVANYGSGSAAVLPIAEGGKLGEPSGSQQHGKGSGVVKGRQEGPHAHSINLDPANKFAFVADLGLDKVMIYKFNAAKGTIEANETASLDLAPGAGPRHFAFHPSGKYAYVINEIDLTITACTYDADKGALKSIQSITTIPEGITDRKGFSTAEVVCHPSGKFVYGSNRGQNTIAIFSVDEATGKLKAVGHQGKDVKVPRNFNIDPTGAWMLVGNQDSDSVVVFAIDPKTGELKPTDQKIDCGKPICVKFMPVPR